MKKEATVKLDRLQILLQKKQEIEAEIEALLMPEKVVAPPPDFNLNDEIMKAVDTAAGEIGGDEIYRVITSRWGMSLPRRKLNSALVYLADRKKVIGRIVGKRGVFIKKQETSA